MLTNLLLNKIVVSWMFRIDLLNHIYPSIFNRQILSQNCWQKSSKTCLGYTCAALKYCIAALWKVLVSIKCQVWIFLYNQNNCKINTCSCLHFEPTYCYREEKCLWYVNNVANQWHHATYRPKNCMGTHIYNL